jgi:hypothetical protein
MALSAPLPLLLEEANLLKSLVLRSLFLLTLEKALVMVASLLLILLLLPLGIAGKSGF